MTASTEKTARTRRIDAVRQFSRFYTRRIGALRPWLAGSPFSLTEARVLYELAHRKSPAAAELARDLALDEGYLSRILARFARSGLVSRKPSATDGRRTILALTPQGAHAFGLLDRRSQEDAAAILDALPERGQARIVDAMSTIERLIEPASAEPPIIIRAHRPGDMGWVVQRHGALYAEEYNWNSEVEALTAEIVAGFLRTYDPRFEACWIAQRDGENAGSVFLVKESDEVAKLRLLLVEPSARGLGIGVRLVDECIARARTAGYRKLVLWTNDVLVAARRIYENAGFRLISEERHRSFGPELNGQYWELAL